MQQQLAVASWLRGQTVLSKKRGGSMLRGGADEDEDEDRNARFIKRADVMGDFVKAAASLGRLGGIAANDDAGQEQAKTLKEILEEREEQMKDLEQLQGKRLSLTNPSFYRPEAD